ncbi:hypothetical protein AM501_27160 [Aneurinibacillus migulanus]|uniref:DMT family transporter n=1 Tax=Aneurinibacillus migulanus TaxID=47500 RepID=UPI0005BAEE93|nr:multidrug efflux SMR transporter [Aneurinibacillus migulanus]KIV56970.1 membrane protein [Aneurinibacillus migulanus]KPD05249.1 hypothetical protein AM501_27160 [Aneurinibacillus migulanus]MED4726957.1 multidrug efflux SMR transporter [Aneurinibacillus migulanus]CEH28883.1 Multidrug resistance protein, SMR family [Aneurinibacillus migulanus]
MNWLLIGIAALLEIVWASSLKYADSLLDWFLVITLIAVSFLLLIRAYKTIPVAVAYAVFVGLGTVGTYLVGIFLGEPFSIYQIAFLLMILSGIAGMKLTTGTKKKNLQRGEQ